MLSLGGCFVLWGDAVKYNKPPLTFSDQAKLLIARGMEGDETDIANHLSSVNYYRLSGYWYHRLDGSDVFKPGTTFRGAWDRYVFDRKLKLLVMDAVERIEIAIRTWVSYHHSHEHGAFAYAVDPSSLPGLSPGGRSDLLKRIGDEVDRSQRRETFIDHFKSKYGDAHTFPPLWVATEVMSFGSIIQLYQGSSNAVKKPVASELGVSHSVLRSWLWSLNEVRNICAHHSRLWNRQVGNKPVIPKKEHHPVWHEPPVDSSRVYGILCVCSHSLSRISSGSRWQQRVHQLLNAYPKIPMKNMGFPENWLTSKLWEKTR
jgi:abortive infection bacteriophage resistance protein